MIPLVIIATAAGLPLLLSLVLRVNAVMVFLAVIAGSLLERSAGDSVELALAMVLRDMPVAPIAHITLLVLPVVLTLFFLRKTLKSSQFLLHIVPLALSCAVFAALLFALLPGGIRAEVYADSIGGIIRQSSDLVTSVAVVLNMLLAWRVFHRAKSGHGKHH